MSLPPFWNRRSLLVAAGGAAAWLATGRAVQAQTGSDEEAASFDADGFRRTRYRAPVDRAPAPAQSLPLARALRLRPGHDALFLDVLPAEGARRDPGTGQWLGAPAHSTIPGAQWYPEVGRGPPDAVLWAGFVRVVRQVRARHPDWPVVVFCRADCWMSWNAARRLARMGFPEVWWLAEGIDGWHDHGRPLAPASAAITLP